MATKVKEIETPETQAPETQGKDPHRKVKIKIPREKNKGGIYANVNTHNFFIPRGEVVEVPAYIAEVLETSAQQDEATALLIERLTDSADF